MSLGKNEKSTSQEAFGRRIRKKRQKDIVRTGKRVSKGIMKYNMQIGALRKNVLDKG